MVRLADLPEWERDHMLKKIPSLPKFGITAWVAGEPLARSHEATPQFFFIFFKTPDHFLFSATI